MIRSLIFVLLVLAFCWLMVSQWDRQIAGEDAEPISRFDLFDGDTATCEISYYSSPEHGRPTASGEIFDSTALTCASVDKIPFSKMVCFRNGDRECVAVVTDRMPRIYRKTNPRRKYDVSKAVAESLGIVLAGVKTVETKVIR